MVPQRRTEDWKATNFNARSECIDISRAFRDSFKRRLCLVGANGWWEWKDKGGKRKQRYWIELRDKVPIMFAGIWDRYETADTAAGQKLQRRYLGGGDAGQCPRRAPIILYQAKWAQWMDLNVDVGVLLGREPLDRFMVTPVELNV